MEQKLPKKKPVGFAYEMHQNGSKTPYVQLLQQKQQASNTLNWLH